MGNRVLVTGGAGFIGSHVVDELLSAGYEVRVLDNMSPQVHGGKTSPPDYLNDEAEFVLGDVRDPATTAEALRGCQSVIHLAAAVGVGQSMYQVTHYVSSNDLATAVLMESLIERPVAKLVV